LDNDNRVRGDGVSELAQIEKVMFLQSADLFAYCKAEQVLRLANIAYERRYTRGETIFLADQPPERLHCLVQGSVQIDGPEGASQVGPLQAFGIRDVLTGRLRQEKAIATDDALVLTIEVEDLFDLLACNIEIVKAIFRQCLDPNGAGPTGSTPS